MVGIRPLSIGIDVKVVGARREVKAGNQSNE